MKVTTELIEKYNQGKCTPSEITAVESWLLSDEEYDEINISLHSEIKLKMEMWNDISEILPSKAENNKAQIFHNRFLWAGVAATVSILLAVSVTFYTNLNSNTARQARLTNMAAKVLRAGQQEIRTEDFNIVLGDKSNASFNSDKGLVDFCGAIKISPKKDIRLSFSDVCAKDSSTSKGIDFKKGQTYFAINYRNQESDQVVVLNENLIFELPPIIKNQLSDQFDI